MGENRGASAVFSIATVISLLLASLPGTRALADDGHSFAREVGSTTAELGGALVGSTALLAAAQGTGSLGATPVSYTCDALAPAAASGCVCLVGRWLDCGGSYSWSALGAYAGTGVGLLVGAEINNAFPTTSDYTPVYRVLFSMYVGGNLGAVIGYKLSRRRPEPDESRLRLDPPSFALSLVRGHGPLFGDTIPNRGGSGHVSSHIGGPRLPESGSTC